MKTLEEDRFIPVDNREFFVSMGENTKLSLNSVVTSLPVTNAEPLPQISVPPSETVGRLQFVENVGQFDDPVRFLVRGTPGNIHFTDDAVWFTFWTERNEDFVRCLYPSFVADDLASCSEETEREGVVLKWSFEGANPNPNIVAFAPQDINLSYFLGNNPEHWAANVPVYGGIRYEDVYPGIDIEYTSNAEGYWQPRVIAEAGADLSLVSLKVEGADSEQITENQTLLLDTAIGSVELPLLLFEESQETLWYGSPTVSHHTIKPPFASSASRRQQSNPNESQLRYSTYIGGDDSSDVEDVALDENGNSYVLVQTHASDLITTVGATTFQGSVDAYIAKIDTNGNLVFATYLGGSNNELPLDLQVDEDQSIYVAGGTGSTDYPTTPGAYDSTIGGNWDAFVTKLASSGTALVYSTFVGGSGDEDNLGFIIDQFSNAYIAGRTNSCNFPTSINAFDTTCDNMNGDAYVFKLNSTGTTMAYGTYFGGNQRDNISGITVDDNGYAYILGATQGDIMTTVGALYETYRGGQADHFIAKINADATALIYSTYLGGSDKEPMEPYIGGIAVDQAYNVLVAHFTYSSDFPLTIPSHPNASEIYVAKLNPNGSALVYSRFFGGTWGSPAVVQGVYDLKIDDLGQAYFIGYSNTFDYPTTSNAYQQTHNGGLDAVFTILSSDGMDALYSTYLGGSDREAGYALAIDEESNSVLLAGYTYSEDFPITPNALYSTHSGSISDGFLTKLVIDAGPPTSPGQDWRVECPFCSAANSQGIVRGINTRTGTYAYAAAPLQLDTLVQSLAFQYGYISAATDMYDETMGYGWAHIFEMQLHFDDPDPSHTIIFQAPGGSRFPYYGNGNGTYTPYAGVTAQLERFDGTLPEDTQYVMTTFNQLSFTFNYQGKLVFAADSAGNTYYLTYDGNGRLYRAYQGTRYLEYDYDGQGRLWHVKDHTNRTVTLAYDGTTGDLIRVTDPLNRATEYRYEGAPHLLTEIIDPSGRTYHRIAYDGQNRAYRLWDGDGNILVDITFDVDFNLVNSSDLSTVSRVVHQGVVMTHTYGTRGTLVDSTNACTDGTPGCGANTAAGFDYHFNHNYVEDANGNPTALTWSDNGSNVEQVVDALNNSTALTYDTFNNLTQVVNAQGNTTTYYFDNLSFPTFRTRQVNSLNQTTYYTPTSNGLLSEVRDPAGLITRHWYNEYGQMTQTVRAYGTSEAITTLYGYDTIGRRITTTQMAVGIDPITTLNVYDAADQLIATLQNWQGTNPANWLNDCAFTPGPRDSNICTRYGYDEAGRTISTTNALGQTSLTFYNDAGHLYLRVENYDGTPNYDNDPVGVLCDWGDPDPEYNLCTLTEYDSNGRVVTTTDVLGHINRTFYDSLGRTKATVVNSVNVTTSWTQCTFPPVVPDEDLCTLYTYDAAGNVLQVEDSAGRITLTVYDALNRVVGTIRNWDSNITLDDCYTTAWLNQTERDENICSRNQYDELGNTIIVSDTLGRMTRTFYDVLGRVEGSIRNWDGQMTLDDCWNSALPANRDTNICTRYSYDVAGNRTVTTNALGQKTLTVYDVVQRPFIEVTNWDGTTTTWPQGCANTSNDPTATVNLCTFTAYDGLGRRASVTNAMGHVTEYAYDDLGRVITTTRYLNSQPILTVVAYDALGNQLSQTDANDHTVTYTYDSLNRRIVTRSHEGVVITTTYNAASWVMGTIDGLDDTTTNQYDELGRLVVATDEENNPTLYAYDGAGNQVAVTDAEGVVTAYEYDNLNRQVRVIRNQTLNTPDHENNVLTQIRYDVLGNRLVITNALNFTSSLTLYDALNRPISVKDGLGHETQYEYNVLGQRTVMTDANGAITLYEYDPLNRLDTITYVTDGETVEYIYNALGQQLVMTDSLGVTTYQYDELARLTDVASPMNETVHYDYDAVGNRMALTYPGDFIVTYEYDGDDRMIAAVDWKEGLTTYEYDVTGRLITTTLPNGVVTVNTYDAADRLVNLTHSGPSGQQLAEYHYELDGVGNRIVATETVRIPGIAPLAEATGLATGIADQQTPDVAYAIGLAQPQYLLVWRQNGGGIRAQRMNDSGQPIGNVLTVSSNSTAKDPAVAYDPDLQQYMVVWEEGGNIRTRRIKIDGSFANNALTIFSATASATGSYPDVVYNQVSDFYLVVWREQVTNLSGTTYHIRSRRTPGSYLVVTLTSQTAGVNTPAIAVADDGTFMVVWEDNRGFTTEIYGQRLTSSGGLSGSNLAITNNGTAKVLPDITWQANTDSYLVAWQTGDSIWGQELNSSGSALHPAFVFYAGQSPQLGQQPAVTADLENETYLVTWVTQNTATSDYAIQSQLTDGETTLGEVVTLADEDSLLHHPAAAAGADSEYVTVWQDQRGGNNDIWGTMLEGRPLQTTVITYTYDPLYRLTETVYSGAMAATLTYAYDAVGNRLAYTATITATEVTTYQYDVANRLVQSVVQGGDTTNYQWDDANRLITTTVAANVVRLYAYSQDGDLLTATVNGLVTTFAYDGSDNRLLMSVAGQVTTYTIDYAGGGQVLFEEGGTFANTKHYLYGQACIGEFINAAEPDSERRYYHRDGRQMVRQTTNDEANVTLAWVYTPEGVVLMGEEGPVTHLDCGAGAVYDWSTGLIFKNGKYFDPGLGVWLTIIGIVVYQGGWQLSRRRWNWGKDKRRIILLGLLLVLTLVACDGEGLEVEDLGEEIICSPNVWQNSQTETRASQHVKIRSVSGPETSFHGSYNWRVAFELETPALADGWVIQEINLTHKVYQGKDDLMIERPPYYEIEAQYWEAWKVEEGNTERSREVTVNYDDEFNGSGFNDSSGFVRVVGIVKFYEGSLPSTFRVDPTSLAGALDYSEVPPPYWDFQGTAHIFDFHWDSVSQTNRGVARYGSSQYTWGNGVE